MAASTIPVALREIGFDQNLDQPVPLDITFRNEGATKRDARLDRLEHCYSAAASPRSATTTTGSQSADSSSR